MGWKTRTAVVSSVSWQSSQFVIVFLCHSCDAEVCDATCFDDDVLVIKCAYYYQRIRSSQQVATVSYRWQSENSLRV